MDQINTEQIKLENFLKTKLAEDEVVLWQGKPDKNILFKEEKVNLVFPGFTFYLIVVFGSYLIDVHHPENAIYAALWLSLFFIAFVITDISKWFFRKKNTLFVITNKRVLDIFMNDSYNTNDITIHEKKLNEIRKYEIRRTENGGNLHLGNKRLPNIHYNSYNEMAEDIHTRTFNTYMNHINYFCFFDLADVDTPAALIREYAVNAVEYIDPKIKLK